MQTPRRKNSVKLCKLESWKNHHQSSTIIIIMMYHYHDALSPPATHQACAVSLNLRQLPRACEYCDNSFCNWGNVLESCSLSWFCICEHSSETHKLFQCKDCLSSFRIPIVEVRRSWDQLIFIMVILVQHLYIHSSERHTGACLNVKTVFPSKGIPIIKIRRSWDRLICIMVILIQHLYIHSSERHTGACLNVKTVFPSKGIPIIKVRRSYTQLPKTNTATCFNTNTTFQCTGIPILKIITRKSWARLRSWNSSNVLNRMKG